jgi:hypothetical protein
VVAAAFHIQQIQQLCWLWFQQLVVVVQQGGMALQVEVPCLELQLLQHSHGGQQVVLLLVVAEVEALENSQQTPLVVEKMPAKHCGKK